MRFSLAWAGVVSAVICCWVRVASVLISLRQGASAVQTLAAHASGLRAPEQALRVTVSARRTRRETGRAARMGCSVRGASDNAYKRTGTPGGPDVPASCTCSPDQAL